MIRLIEHFCKSKVNNLFVIVLQMKVISKLHLSNKTYKSMKSHSRLRQRMLFPKEKNYNKVKTKRCDLSDGPTSPSDNSDRGEEHVGITGG